MKTVVHFLPAKRPLPRTLIRVLMAEAREGKQIVLVRS